MVGRHQQSLLKSFYRLGPVTLDIVCEPLVPLLVERVCKPFSQDLHVLVLPHVFGHVLDLNVLEKLVSSDILLDLFVLLLLLGHWGLFLNTEMGDQALWVYVYGV